MRSDWQPATLGDLVDIKHGFAFPGEYFKDEPPGDILLTPGNFAIGGGFKADKLKYYNGTVSDDFVLSENDLIVTMTDLSKSADTLGYPALIPASKGHRYLHNQRLGKVQFRSESKLDKNFLYYLMRTREYRNEVLASATGTTVKHTSPERIKAFTFSLPPIPEQRSIARVLGALDEKIKLNRAMNERLEATARALFKSWFVDFDPVRAKTDGRRTSTCTAFMHLFSDRLQESSIGKIPAGWRMSSLGVEARRCGGQIQTGPFGSQLHASDYVSGRGVPVVMPKNILNRRVSTREIARVTEADAERLSRYRLKAGDIVYSRRGDVERHAWISSNEAGWLCGTGCLLVRMGSKWTAPLFISFALDRPESKAWIAQRAIGATMPNLNTSILSEFPVAVPPDAILSAFASLADPIELLVSAKNAENKTLAKLRDTLVPKLISGVLRLRELDGIAEATKA